MSRYFKKGIMVLLLSIFLGGCGGGKDSSSSDNNIKSASNYSIGGTVTGLSGTIVLQNNGTDDLSISTDGDFTFTASIPDGSPYDVSVKTEPNGQTCAISNGSGVISGGNITIVKVTCDNESASPWNTRTSMPTERIYFAGSAVNGKVYLIGGITADWNTTLSIVEEYDPTTDSWTTKTQMPTARYRMHSSVVNQKIYVIGGISSDGIMLSTIEVYDPVTDSWTTKTPMPTARYGATNNISNNKIYMIGGGFWNDTTPMTSLDIVEEYDPGSNTWTNCGKPAPENACSPMPVKEDEFASSVLDEKIYAFGEGGFHIYNPTANSWEIKNSMNNPRSALTTTVINEIIYIIGGGNNCDESGFPCNLIEKYYPTNDTWDIKTPMPTPRSLMSGNVVNGKIYVFGGYVRRNSDDITLSITEEYNPMTDNN